MEIIRIKSFNGLELRNSEYLELMKNVADKVSTCPATMGLGETLTQFQELLGEANRVRAIRPSSDLTPSIRAADKNRNRMYRSLKKQAQANLAISESDECRAGEKVLRNMKEVGNILYLNDEAKTSKIYQLVDKLMVENLTPELHQKVTFLKQRNESFVLLWRYRKDERPEKYPRSVRKLRKKLDTAFRLMVEEINVLARKSTEEYRARFVTLCSEINSIFFEYHNLIAGRATRRGRRRKEGAASN